MESETFHAEKSVEQLPVELLLDMIAYLPKKGDLANLCLVSKQFKSIVLPLLYGNLHIRTYTQDSWSRQLSLVEALANPHFANLVTTVHVTLLADPICPYRHPSITCTCDGYDIEVGKALSRLRNLQYLFISCNLCEAPHGRHSYLFDGLQTRRLQEFTFHCFCLVQEKHDDHVPAENSILTAPHMQTVTSLLFGCSKSWLVDATGTFDTLLRRADVLPHLKILGYIVTPDSVVFEFPYELLATRPISRVLFRHSPSTSDLMHPTQRTLEYLSGHDAFAFLPQLIEHLDSYAHLKYFGTFTFRSSKEEDVLHALRPLLALKVLDIIEINQFIIPHQHFAWMDEAEYERFQPNNALIEEIGRQHHSLRRIYHVYRSFFDADYHGATLWEYKGEGAWTSRVVPFIEKWEVLKGALYTL